MSVWIETPLLAYEHWAQAQSLAGRPYARQSQRQYGSMFAAFVRWLAAEGLSLVDLEEEALQRFIEQLRGRQGAAASIRTRRIYLLEIGRVLEHLRAEGLRPDNPAREMARRLRAEEPLAPRNSALVSPQVRVAYLRHLDDLEASEQAEALSPEVVRAHAMALLMLELGLTLKEVQKLTLAALEDLPRGWLQAPGHRLLRSRRLPVPERVARWLGRWLSRRQTWVVRPAGRRKAGEPASAAASGLHSDLPVTLARVFVVRVSARAKRAEAARRAVNRISDWLIREAAVDAIALSHPQWPRHLVRGPQMLRNLCFLRLLREHEDDEAVVSFLGLRDATQVRWMRKKAASLQ